MYTFLCKNNSIVSKFSKELAKKSSPVKILLLMNVSDLELIVSLMSNRNVITLKGYYI